MERTPTGRGPIVKLPQNIKINRN